MYVSREGEVRSKHLDGYFFGHRFGNFILRIGVTSSISIDPTTGGRCLPYPVSFNDSPVIRGIVYSVFAMSVPTVKGYKNSDFY